MLFHFYNKKKNRKGDIMEEKNNIRMEVLCALFAAVCAVCAQIIIPIQPVPISLSTFGVLLAGGFLGPKYGTMSIVIYLLLGAVGVPVFSMMRGGLAVITGPAGGFIIGYLPMAFLIGYLSRKWKYSYLHVAGAAVIGTIACYIVGILWFIFLTHTTVWAALLLCVFPFIPGDIAKILLVTFLVGKYRGRLVGVTK